MKNYRKIFGALLCAAAVTAAPAFCDEVESETEQALLQIGQKAENDYEVELTNSTGKGIVSLAISVDGEEYSDNLLSEGQVFEADSSALLYCTPAEIKEGQTTAPKYDLELVFDDDLTAGLHTFPFGDADKVTILLDELTGDDLDEGTEEEMIEIAYIRFVSKSLGTEQDTQWHEWDVVAPGKAEEAAAIYAAKIAAQQAASAASYWSDDAGTSYAAPSGNGGGNTAGNTEQCLNGGLLN